LRCRDWRVGGGAHAGGTTDRAGAVHRFGTSYEHGTPTDLTANHAAGAAVPPAARAPAASTGSSIGLTRRHATRAVVAKRRWTFAAMIARTAVEDVVVEIDASGSAARETGVRAARCARTAVRCAAGPRRTAEVRSSISTRSPGSCNPAGAACGRTRGATAARGGILAATGTSRRSSPGASRSAGAGRSIVIAPSGRAS